MRDRPDLYPHDLAANVGPLEFRHLVGLSRRRGREWGGCGRVSDDPSGFLEGDYLRVRKLGREANPGKPRVRNRRIWHAKS